MRTYIPLSFIGIFTAIALPSLASSFGSQSYDPNDTESQQIVDSVNSWLQETLPAHRWKFGPGINNSDLSGLWGQPIEYIGHSATKDEIKCKKWSDGAVTCQTPATIRVKIKGEEKPLKAEIGVVKKDDRFVVDASKALPYQPLEYAGVWSIKDSNAKTTVVDSTTKGTSKEKYYVYSITFNGKNELTYEDRSFKISFTFPALFEGIKFQLENKLTTEIQIDWNKSSIVDVEKNAQIVTHEGVRFVDASSVKAPTIIPPGAKVTDTAIPANRITYIQSWYVATFLPLKPATGNPAVDRQLNFGDGEKLKNKSFVLWLAFNVGGKEQKKYFTFEIKDVRLQAH